MVNKCVAPNCKSGYANKNTHEKNDISLFSFPKDSCTRDLWISSIPRENFEPTKNSRLCERHFLLTDVEILNVNHDGSKQNNEKTRKSLKSNAVPCLWPE